MPPPARRVAPLSWSFTLLLRWMDPMLYVPGAKLTTPPPMLLQLSMAALMAAVLAPAATGQVRSGKLGSFTAAGLLNIPGAGAGAGPGSMTGGAGAGGAGGFPGVAGGG